MPMDPLPFDRLSIISGTSNPQLSDEITKVTGISLTPVNITRFADGEISVTIGRRVRGQNVFIVQSLCPPDINSSIMELLLLIDAAQRASAACVIAVIPYLAYSRQDRKAYPRQPISSKMLCDILVTAGADRIIFMELHAPQIQGFFKSRIQIDAIYSFHDFAKYLNSVILRDEGMNVVIVTPDAGGTARARQLATRVGGALAIIDKRRPRANESEVMHVIGDVAGKCTIIYDDIADTAGTLCNAAIALEERGASKIMACVTHALLSDPAAQRIRDSPIQKFICLNTIPITEKKKAILGDKLIVLSAGYSIAKVIQAVHMGRSVGEIFVDATPHITAEERRETVQRRLSVLEDVPPIETQPDDGDQSE